MDKKYLFPDFKHFIYGADYNPEQWKDDKGVLAEDIRLMKKANLNEMTVGIFSWALLEPQEGKFDFTFLDETIDRIFQAGGRVVLATPSGARPAWLSEKYPEVLRVNNNFVRIHHGRRHNHCYTSPVYREKVRLIDEELAKRYASHPAVIAWHLSNEYGGECYCPLCIEAFRAWLKEKYITIDNLNKQWWTGFWSHTYFDFSQIEPPAPLVDSSNMALIIDWHRFVSEQTCDFMKTEIDAVRKYDTLHPITTNFQGIFYDLDYFKHARMLDVISNDIYPRWQGKDETDIDVAVEASLIHDYMRSLKQQPFMIMECTPSLVNWHPYNKLKRPGMNELAALQGISHGADTVQYFQFRKGRGGEEKFHGAVVDHNGTENTRVFRETSALGKRLKAIHAVLGTKTNASVAVFYDQSNRWAIDASRGFANNDKKYIPTLLGFYKALWKKGINTDVVCSESDLSSYSFIIAPMLYMADEALQNKLAKYVYEGGTLLCTYMTAMVGETDLCHLGGFPGGVLKDVFGLVNEEIDTLYPGEKNTVLLKNGSTVNAVDYCELIHPHGCDTLAVYSSDFYNGMSAVTKNSYGKGNAYYVAFRDEGDYSDKIVCSILREIGIKSDFDGELPNGVTAHSRTDGENIYVFLQNFTRCEQTVNTDVNWINIEDGNLYTGSITLKPYESLILKHYERENE